VIETMADDGQEVATVTAIQSVGDRVTVELDGVPWRTVPLDAAVSARLSPGVQLDRERARELARALRRYRAEEVALRALARREHSRASLEARLARAGVRDAERREALARAEGAGLVDDRRYAVARARTLAERDAGDELVFDDLVRHGVDETVACVALASLEPERDRLERVVARRGLSTKTVRFLAAKGFASELLEDLVAEIESRALG
jgi:regulatory protein